MGPQEWYNNNLSETKQNLNKVNKTILYISYKNTAFCWLHIDSHRLMELQRTDYHYRSLLHTHPFSYND